MHSIAFRSITLTQRSPEIFDEYTRRQFVAKAPQRNPYGDEEEPAKFDDFDVFTKIRVLQQLSTWTLGNAERIRGIMPADEDHLTWRMEPIGWDKEDRTYYVLDDNRLYRRTDEPPPPPSPKPKAKSKAKKTPKRTKSRGTRSSKRRKIEESEDEEMEEEQDAEGGAQEDTVMTNGDTTTVEEEPGYGFTNKTWECIAVTLDEYNDFMASIFRTRDPNEKQLRKTIEENVLPVIEKRAETLRAKQMKKMRELENLQKMATAKRSSRIADKAEKEKHDRELQEAEDKKKADLRMAHEEQERQKRIEEGHESRRLTREQRLKEREVKRILHEEELARIEEQANRPESQEPSSDAAKDADKRVSKRQLKTQKEQHQKELDELREDEDRWYFDCSICGKHGENWDDGTHSIACDRCEVWQHSKCHGYSPKQAEKDDFKFVCATCKRKEEDANKPKIPPLKLGKNRSSASPESKKKPSRPSTANRTQAAPLPDHVQRQLDGRPSSDVPRASPGPFGNITNAPSFTPQDQAQTQAQRPPSGYGYPPVGNFAHQSQTPQQSWQSNGYPPSGSPTSGYASSPPQRAANGYGPHHQLHQQAHQHAVSASGGHPAYQAPYHPTQAQSYSPAPPSGGYQMPPQQQYPPPQQYYHQQPQYAQRYPQYQQQQYAPPPTAQQNYQQPRQGSAQLMNGFQSPVKGAARPSASPHNDLRSPYNQPPMLQQQSRHPSNQSPNANFAPPANGYGQQGGPSPVKSSPAPYYPPHSQQHPPPPPHLTHTPHQSFRPPSSSNGVNHTTPNLQNTPQHHLNPSPAGANANAVAADGMSGPWPEESKVIPQKHDQSPAPPGPPIHSHSNHQHQQGGGGEETKFTPPVALAPSPGQAAQAQATGPGSVPVKKMPEANGSTAAPPAHAIEGRGVAPSPSQQMAPSPGGSFGQQPPLQTQGQGQQQSQMPTQQ